MSSYGKPGTEEEWRNNQQEHIPYRGTKTPGSGSGSGAGSGSPAPAAQQPNYVAELAANPELRARARTHVQDIWWKQLCRSANQAKYHAVVFEQHLFDADGLLDAKEPGYRKILQTLAIVYVHVVKKFGEDAVGDFKVRWALNDAGAPYIHARNVDTKAQFGMTAPKGGFIDHAAELQERRLKRDAGLDFEIPDDKKKYYTSASPDVASESASTDEAAVQGDTASSVPDMEDIPVTPAKYKMPRSEDSHIDDEAWGFIEHVDDGSHGDEDMFQEAKLHGAANDGYVYKVEDSKSARKGWMSWW